MDDELHKIFFEIHSDNPREGPGCFDSTKKAFSILKNLPPNPKILDIGCGPGQQTLDLIILTDGTITAVDNHQPFISSLLNQIRKKDLTGRINAIKGDMFDLDFEENYFDLIWAEGSIYIIGFEKGLREWKQFLKKDGYISVTEVTWIKPNPPKELYDFWNECYPAITNVEENLKSIEKAGYNNIAHFILPESAWWEYYNPIEKKLPALREKYKDDKNALAVIEEEENEIELYRSYGKYYGYVFYIAQKI